MESIYQRATDSRQYDRPDLQWDNSSGPDLAFSEFIWHYLRPRLGRIKGSRFLDVGAGTGWLADRLLREGAREAVGVEPSSHNRSIARRLYPSVEMVEGSLPSLPSLGTFDTITLVMMMTHVADVTAAFEDLAAHVRPGGQVILIVPDFAYYHRPRHGYEIQFEERQSGEYVTAVRRSNGVIADVIRTNAFYMPIAEGAGFELAAEVAMTPTESLMERVPKYQGLSGVPLTQMLAFRASQAARDAVDREEPPQSRIRVAGPPSGRPGARRRVVG